MATEEPHVAQTSSIPPSSPVAASASADAVNGSSAPVDSSHPSQRWESAFVYAFICKFTDLRTNVEGFETPMEYVFSS